MNRTEIVKNKRTEFRQQYSSLLFNSAINLLLVLLVFVAGLVISAIRIDWSLTTLLLLPIFFLYAEAVMYIAHCWQQHRIVRFQEKIFEMHAGWHHGMFSPDAMHVESFKDMNMVVLPFFIHGMVIFLFYAPVALIIDHYLGSDIGWILMCGVTLQLIWYEVVHTIAHMKAPPALFARLAQHHKDHHNPKLMGNYNFGIATTLFDRIFGTMHSGS